MIHTFNSEMTYSNLLIDVDVMFDEDNTIIEATIDRIEVIREKRRGNKIIKFDKLRKRNQTRIECEVDHYLANNEDEIYHEQCLNAREADEYDRREYENR